VHVVVLGRTYIVRKVVIKPGGVMEQYNVREYVDVRRQQHAAMTLVSGCFSNHVGEAK